MGEAQLNSNETMVLTKMDINHRDIGLFETQDLYQTRNRRIRKSRDKHEGKHLAKKESSRLHGN